jgi:spore maturation protein CgeB
MGLGGLKGDLIEKIISTQIQHPRMDIFAILDGVQQGLGFRLRFRNIHHRIHLAKELEFIAMARLRKGIIEGIAEFEPYIWGDSGWRSLLGNNKAIRYMKMIDYRKELPILYSVSKINLNITKAHLKRAVPQRVYDASACGGFVLTDYREDLHRLFQIGREIIYYHDLSDLKDKIKFYLRHDDEKKENS